MVSGSCTSIRPSRRPQRSAVSQDVVLGLKPIDAWEFTSLGRGEHPWARFARVSLKEGFTVFSRQIGPLSSSFFPSLTKWTRVCIFGLWEENWGTWRTVTPKPGIKTQNVLALRRLRWPLRHSCLVPTALKWNTNVSCNGLDLLHTYSCKWGA